MDTPLHVQIKADDISYHLLFNKGEQEQTDGVLLLASWSTLGVSMMAALYSWRTNITCISCCGGFSHQSIYSNCIRCFSAPYMVLVKLDILIIQCWFPPKQHWGHSSSLPHRSFQSGGNPHTIFSYHYPRSSMLLLTEFSWETKVCGVFTIMKMWLNVSCGQAILFELKKNFTLTRWSKPGFFRSCTSLLVLPLLRLKNIFSRTVRESNEILFCMLWSSAVTLLIDTNRRVGE